MQSTPESIPSTIMAELNRLSAPMRPVQLARLLNRVPASVGGVLSNLYMLGKISRVLRPADPAYSYFMTPEQKADWLAKATKAVEVQRRFVKVEPIDIPARLRFLQMLADNPAIQDYAQLHCIIGDYRRTLTLQQNYELTQEEEAV